MVKRVVDTKFWTSMDVIDHYSIEDKFFALYLMTNDKSSQVGIYSLPKKIISFETGFKIELIDELLKRFSSRYGQIIYSEETQEISLLTSLEYSILKGGRPVSDLLKRELRVIQDGRLILVTYQIMQNFWKASQRKFDQTIQKIFEEELIARDLLLLDNDNQKENQSQNNSQSQSDNENQNDNHNQELSSPNRGTNRPYLINSDHLMPEEQVYLTKYLDILRDKKPSFNETVKTTEILDVFYQELLGEVTPTVKDKIKAWETDLPKSLILEAFVRSIDKFNPLAYITTIIDNWREEDVKSLRDVSRLDRRFNQE